MKALSIKALEEAVNNIIKDNQITLVDFFKGIASGSFYDGTCYRLYLNLNSKKIKQYHLEHHNLSFDGKSESLALITQIEGYEQSLSKQLYSYRSHENIEDFGLQSWLVDIKGCLTTILNHHKPNDSMSLSLNK